MYKLFGFEQLKALHNILGNFPFVLGGRQTHLDWNDRCFLKSNLLLFQIFLAHFHLIGGTIVGLPNRFTNEKSFCFDIILRKEI